MTHFCHPRTTKSKKLIDIFTRPVDKLINKHNNNTKLDDENKIALIIESKRKDNDTDNNTINDDNYNTVTAENPMLR